MSDSQIIFFLITSILLIVTPGQDFMLVITRSISMGKKAGMATIAGVSTSLIIHSVLVAFGLGALIQTSEILFSVMKIIGAFYLLYLGFKTFRAKPIEIDTTKPSNISSKRLFIEGLISNLCNPKVIIFYIAFLPQFVGSTSANPTQTLFILGVVFAVVTFILIGSIGMLAGSMSGWLREKKSVQTILNRISGIILVGFAVRLFTAERTA